LTSINQACVIFGTGLLGQHTFHKLKHAFTIIAYTDNNPSLWGKSINDIPIIPPNELVAYVAKNNALVFICNNLHWNDIARQLDEMGLNYYVHNQVCYELVDEILYPVSFGVPDFYRKEFPTDFSVLFVQDKSCTRTDKIANVLKDRGIKTYSAYTFSPSKAGSRSFFDEYAFWTHKDLLEFVNKSEFDVIHCSNEPDVLVNLLIHSNKKIIHDCHDMMSARNKNISLADVILEELANTRATGFMYTTNGLRDVAIRKYGTDINKTLVVGNFPLSSFSGVKKLPKLSERDGEIHCVYEGGVNDANGTIYRFFEPIWLKLAENWVHVHIYSQQFSDYCRSLEHMNPYLHYEGDYSSEALISEMTQYDIGLAMYNLSNRSDYYLNFSSPNKITEYLSAGLPVVSNVIPFIDMLTQNGGGGELNMEGDIQEQLREYQKIMIAEDFLQTHELTMDANADRILKFYKAVGEI